MSSRVIGLDLSITAPGIANGPGATYTIDPRATGDARLAEIRDAVYLAAGGCPPGLRGMHDWVDLAVIEDLPPVRARAAGVLGMVHGVVRHLLLDVGVPYALVPPASLKRYATGTGTASKPDMRMELFKRAGEDVRSDDQVDAWWLRAMGLDHLGAPEVVLPGTHRTALRKITWPDG